MPASRVQRATCMVGGVLACALVRADDPVDYDFFDYLGAMVEVNGAWVDAVAMDESTTEASDSEAVDAEQYTNDELMELTPNASDPHVTDTKTGDT